MCPLFGEQQVMWQYNIVRWRALLPAGTYLLHGSIRNLLTQGADEVGGFRLLMSAARAGSVMPPLCEISGARYTAHARNITGYQTLPSDVGLNTNLEPMSNWKQDHKVTSLAHRLHICGYVPQLAPISQQWTSHAIY